MKSTVNNGVPNQVLQGGGLTGELIRSFDWSTTPLGAFNKWPHSLQSALGICINSNFPIAIYWGPELTLIYNDAWSPIPGNKHPWALGKPAKEVWPDIWADIEPQFQLAFTGKPGGSQDALLPMQRHGYTEECYFDFTFTPIYGDAGKVDGIFNAVIETTFRVISGRRAHALQRLAEVVTSLDTPAKVFEACSKIFDHIQEDIPFYFSYLKTQHDEVKHISQRADFHGKVIQEWPFSDTKKSFLLIENPEDYLSEIPQGPWPEKPAKAFITPLNGVDGTTVGYLVLGVSARLAFDKDYQTFFESIATIISRQLITISSLVEERRRAETLAEIDKAKTIFFNNISHEFRTPLTLMLSPLESVLSSADYLKKEHLNDLQISLRNSRRLQKLVNTLLDFSRIEAGKIDPKFESVDIVQYTEDLASSFRSAIEAAGIVYQVNLDDVHAPVMVDVDMWEKIVLNLISNAFKYTRQGKIEVSIYEENKNVVLKVKDTGIGISKENIDKIFERFYRVNSDEGRSQEGTGIGLALVKELVSLHGGTITVNSEVGCGSEFMVTLPVVERTGTAKTYTNKNQHQAHSAFIDEIYQWNNNQESAQLKTNEDIGKQKVLLADDNSDMREYVERLLTAVDFDVRSVSNGDDALSAAIDWVPDIIVSDIMMPKLDGFELLKKLKSNLVTRNIPVIFLSARAGEEARIEGIQAGADDYLVKPFSAKELVARVQNHALISKVRRQTEQQFYNLFLQSPAHIHIMKGPEHVMEFFHPLGKPFVGGRDITGMKIRDAIPEVAGQGFFEMLDQVYHEGKSFFLPESKALFPLPDGTTEEFYFNITYLPWRDVHGKVQGVLQFTFDVTQQAKANLKIKESEEHFRLLATSIPQISWITDSKGDIEYLSDQWEKYTGQKAAEGRAIFSSLIHEDDIDEVRARWTKARAEGTPWNAEFRLKDLRNKKYTWFAGSTLPLKNETGKVLKWVGSASDISFQKEQNEILTAVVSERTAALRDANEALKMKNNELVNTRNFLQTVLDSSIELVTVFDTDLNFTYINKRALDFLQGDPASQIGRNLRGVHADFESTDLYQCLQRALKGEVVHIPMRRPLTGSNTVFETFIIPLRREGKITGILMLQRDITDITTLTENLKMSNLDFQRSNEDLQQFAHVTSHDLKEPVRKIKMYGNLLKNNYATIMDERGKSYLDKIERATGRIYAMIEGVLQYSSVDALQTQFEAIDLQNVCRNIIEDLELAIREKKAEVKINNLPVIRGSQTLIYQLFYNLINNSLKFIKPGVAPLIEITSKLLPPAELEAIELTSLNGDYYQIDVRDNGIGFEQTYADKIFESFMRLNPKDKYEGTGLGLALCKKIVERHNGVIKAYSSPGQGSVFSIFLHGK